MHVRVHAGGKSGGALSLVYAVLSGLNALPAGKCEGWGKNKHSGGVQISHASRHISEHNLPSLNASARILVYPGELPCWILHAPEIDFLRIGL